MVRGFKSAAGVSELITSCWNLYDFLHPFTSVSTAVKEAAVQRRHNLYRDSIVLNNSDPSLHLLGENPSIDWAGEYGGGPEEADSLGEEAKGDAKNQGEESLKQRRMKQVVSMIQVEGSSVQNNELCIEVPSIKDIPVEDGDEKEQSDGEISADLNGSEASGNLPDLSNLTVSREEEIKTEEKGKEEVPLKVETASEPVFTTQGEVQAEDIQVIAEEQSSSDHEVLEEALPPPPPPSEEIPPEATDMSPESPPEELSVFPPPPEDDSGFQSPTSENAEDEDENLSTAVPQAAEEHTEKMEKSVAAAPQAETTTTDSAREQWWHSFSIVWPEHKPALCDED